MRQRKVKNEAIRLAAVEYLQIGNGQKSSAVAEIS